MSFSLQTSMPVALLATLALALASVAPLAAAVERVEITVEGMACPFCAYGIEKRLRTVDGVGSIDVDIEGGEATIHAAEGASIALGEIPGAVRSAGFTPGAMEATVRGRIDLADPNRPLLRVSGSGQEREQELLLVNLSEEERARIEELTTSEGDTEVRVRGAVHVHENRPPGIEPVAIEPVEAAEQEAAETES